MVTRARFSIRSAALADDFGLDWATKLFGAEALAELPRFVRGPKNGKLKGFVCWLKVEPGCGGWSHQYGVLRPGLQRAWVAASYASPSEAAVYGRWLGRTQALCGTPLHLFEEGRARAAAERAQIEADQVAACAELKAAS